MTDWTAYIATRRHRRGGGDVSERALASFLEALKDHASVAAGNHDGYDATLTVTAAAPAEAVATAHTIVREAAAKSGLPDWPVAHAEVIETAEHDRQLSRPTHPTLVGVTEITGMLAVSKQRVDQLTRERDDFPHP
ncbi:MAG: hypothetical protein GEU79_14540 [Acidimicrobiia bacterium]|nr:hypothetical protein [Acidimicrobiia bacterium]